MSSQKTAIQITSEIYALLEPLESDERQRAIQAVMLLLGEDKPSHSIPIGETASSGNKNGFDVNPVGGIQSLPSAAVRWAEQHDLSREDLDQLFHFEGDSVEYIGDNLPGKTQKENTKYCYLFTGVCSLLATGDPSFSDDDSVELCKQLGAHNQGNHTRYVNAIGGMMRGSKRDGRKLTAPGLKVAADGLHNVLDGVTK